MTILIIVFGLLAALQLKHLVVDFLLQGPYEYLNKGTYGHPGGILHSGKHAGVTLIILGILSTVFGLTIMNSIGLIALGEFIIHYHIDWAKVKVNKALDLTPTTSEVYWWLLGFDQFLHQITYIVITVAFICLIL